MNGESQYTSEDAVAFRKIFDAAPVAIQIIGPNGLFIDCNEETVRLFDARNTSDIIGKPPSILSPEIQPDGSLSNVSATRYIEQVIGGSAVEFEWTHKRLTGSDFSARVVLKPILYQQKSCIMANIFDMSTEKELQATKAENTEITALFKGTSSGMMMLGPDLHILDINPAFEKITGIDRERALQMSLQDFEVIERNGATIADVKARRTPQGGTMIISLPVGIKHLEYLYVPVVGSDGTISKYFEVFSDHTDVINSLHESQAIIAGSPAAIITTDLKGKILSANPAFLELTRIPEEKILTMAIADFTILARDGETIADLIKDKKPISGSMTVDFGSFLKILKYRYVPVTDVNGTINCLVLMYIDITDQLSKIDEITALIESSPYGIITISNDLKILNINHAFETITGYTVDQGIAMSLKDFRIKEKTGGSLEDVKKTGAAVKGTMVIDLPSGLKFLEYTYIPIKNRKGEIVRFFEIFNDVTSLVNQVNESETLVASSPASILTMDTTGKILSINQSFIDICQLPKEQLLSMNIRDFAITERSGGTLTDTLTTKKPVKGRLTVDFTKFKKILDFTYIPVLDTDGNIKKLVSMYIDLTEQVQMVRYLDESVDRIATSINLLAPGNTQFTTEVIDADEMTRKAHDNMIKISSALDVAREAVARLVTDTTTIAGKAVSGNLTCRADPTRHTGDYRKVIEGINQTMESIITPVNEAMRVATAYAGYDFTARINASKGMTGDWTAFQRSLDAIGEQVGEAIRQITSEINTLFAHTDTANRNVGEITGGASQLATNAGSVSANAEQGKEGISQVLRAMEDLAVTVGDVSQKTEQVASLSSESNQMARTGTDLAQKADEGMKVITQNAEETSRIITEIQNEMGQIGKIVRLITDIASQTNLLALNAAIEAARAGEAGRGFAVVAAEVKALATQSRSSAENIAEMIASLQKKSEHASKAVTLATDAVHDGNIALSETLTVFNKLAVSVEEISQYMEQVASMSEEQAANTEEITASVNEVSDLIQNTANEAVNIAGVTEETSASLEHLKATMTEVSQVGEKVTKAINRFTIS